MASGSPLLKAGGSLIGKGSINAVSRNLNGNNGGGISSTIGAPGDLVSRQLSGKSIIEESPSKLYKSFKGEDSPSLIGKGVYASIRDSTGGGSGDRGSINPYESKVPPSQSQARKSLLSKGDAGYSRFSDQQPQSQNLPMTSSSPMKGANKMESFVKPKSLVCYIW